MPGVGRGNLGGVEPVGAHASQSLRAEGDERPGGLVARAIGDRRRSGWPADRAASPKHCGGQSPGAESGRCAGRRLPGGGTGASALSWPGRVGTRRLADGRWPGACVRLPCVAVAVWRHGVGVDQIGRAGHGRGVVLGLSQAVWPPGT